MTNLRGSSQSGSYYNRCVLTLQKWNMQSLLNLSESFFVSPNGDIKLRFPNQRTALKMLFEAKRVVRSIPNCNVNVELLVSPFNVLKKMKMKKVAHHLKEEGLISSFQVIETKVSNEWAIKLRVLSCSGSVHFFKVEYAFLPYCRKVIIGTRGVQNFPQWRMQAVEKPVKHN